MKCSHVIAYLAGGISRPSRYAMAMKIIKSHEKSQSRKEAIEQAEKEEIDHLFVGWQALKPVCTDDIDGVNPFNCHLISVDKFFTDDINGKIKS